MKNHKMICMIVCMMMLTFFASNALASKKVVVLTGVNESSAKAIGSYDMINEGILDVFEDQNIEAEFQYVELTSLKSDKMRDAAGAEAIAKIRTSTPDLIIVLDDVAVRHVALKIVDIPIVFAWIFSSPEALGLPKDNITGVMRRSYAADVFSMAKQLTGAKTVSLLSKDSPSMAGVRQYILAGADALETASGVRVKEMYLVNTFDEWVASVKAFSEDFIYLADTSRVLKGGKELNREEVTRWTVDNAQVPVVGASEADVKAGALFSIVTSEKAIGIAAAEQAIRVLKGAAPADVPYVTSTKGKLIFNTKTIGKYNLDVPYETLSLAEAMYDS